LIYVTADQKTASRYGISGIPATVFLKPDGSVIQSVSGYHEADDYSKTIQEVLNRMKKSSEGKSRPAATAAKQADTKTSGLQEKPEKSKFDMDALKHDVKRKINKAISHNLELTGILGTPDNPSALINDKIVKVGDVIEGAKVVKINKNSVDMSLQDKKFVLDLKYQEGI